MKNINQIVKQFQPGGSFQKAGLKMYEQQKQRDVEDIMQAYETGGLSDVVTTGGAEAAYEEMVGAPFKMGLEQQRLNALLQSAQAKGGYLTRAAERKLRKETTAAERKLKEQLTGFRVAARIHSAKAQQPSRSPFLSTTRKPKRRPTTRKPKRQSTYGRRTHTGDTSAFDIVGEV